IIYMIQFISTMVKKFVYALWFNHVIPNLADKTYFRKVYVFAAKLFMLGVNPLEIITLLFLHD
ncbi:hypothetical protein, partial [Lacrimispora sp.]|uniref:hypothetical protein n=1 Tax=Lacrimispora sp. TaxID=2719234 RepID=UPI0028A96AE6